MSQLVTFDFMYINDPTQSRALFNAKMYFGLVNQDPELVANQVPVYAVAENGDLTQLPQPVLTNSGGNPTYNGSPVRLAVDDNYSFKVLDRNDNQIFYIENSLTFDDRRSSTEQILIGDGQLTGTLQVLTTNNTAFYIGGDWVDRGRLVEGVDYVKTTGFELTSITLTNSFPSNSYITAVQNTIDGTPSGAGNYIFPVYSKGSAWTLADTDSGGFLVFNDGGAAVLTIPDGLSLGVSVLLANIGAGGVSIAMGGSDTLRGASSIGDADGQMSVQKISGTIWQCSER
jgi:hypothetical protein